MPTYGPTSAGWVNKALTTILEEFDAGLKAILGDSAGTEADGSIPLDSAAGQIKVLLADAFAALWDLMQLIYASFDPNQATSAQLDALAALTGTVRNQATYSTVTMILTGENGTLLSTGRIVREADSLAQFILPAETGDLTLTNPTLIDRQTLTAYVEGDICSHGSGGDLNILVCIVAGTTSASTTPFSLAFNDTVVDGTVTWLSCNDYGTSYAYATGSFRAVDTGPVGGAAQQITDIFTPVDGWLYAVNALDAVAGRDKESDPTFRARRDAELAGQGGSTPDGILAAVSRVNAGSTDANHQPPTTVKVFYNDTDFTDSNGLPPHSCEVLVQGGTTADLAQAIFNAIGAGTNSYGNRTDSVVDSEGRTQSVSWSRPVEVPIYVDAVVRYDSSSWPAGSDLLVAEAAKSALLTYTATYPIARDVRVSPLNGAIMRGPSEVDATGTAVVPATTGSEAVVGLLEVETLFISTSPAPSGATQIPISSREVAVFDTSRTTITASSEEP